MGNGKGRDKDSRHHERGIKVAWQRLKHLKEGKKDPSGFELYVSVTMKKKGCHELKIEKTKFMGKE